jgi:hypothetical protein
MTSYRMMALLALPFLLAACAEAPLQRVVDEHKQQRIQDAYANKPVAYGSSDGVGIYSATSSHMPLTLNESSSAH